MYFTVWDFAGNYWSEIKVFQEKGMGEKKKIQIANKQRGIVVLQMHIILIKMPLAQPGWYLQIMQFP